MAGNSWEVVGDWLTGKLEILRVSERSASADVEDTTVTTTFETKDLTAILGTDVVALLAYTDNASPSNQVGSILVIREVGGGDGVTSFRTRHQLIKGEHVPSYNVRLGIPNVLIPCRGTDPGKIQTAQNNTSSWRVNAFEVHVRGRVRP